MLRLTITGLVACVVAVVACAEQRGDALVEFRGATMGTSYSVKLPRGDGAPPPPEIGEEIERRLQAINRAMSTYIDDSDVSRFAAHDDSDWFSVSPATATVVEAALTVHRSTSGAFDVTVRPLVDLWGFGPDPARDTPPTPEAVAKLVERIGADKINVRLQPPALRKSEPGVAIDLSAIAKGYAVDVVSEYLESIGRLSYWVDIGGEVRVGKPKPSGTPWIAGIETPSESLRRAHARVALAGEAMATSGDYRKFFVHDGKRYSHTIDPRTGRPVEHALASVSVVRPSCMEADALATGLLVLGPDSGYDLAVESGWPVLMILRGADGWEVKETPAMQQLHPRESRSVWGYVILGVLVIGVIWRLRLRDRTVPRASEA